MNVHGPVRQDRGWRLTRSGLTVATVSQSAARRQGKPVQTVGRWLTLIPGRGAALDAAPRDRGFGNARLARDLSEHMVRRLAVRIADRAPSDDELVTFTKADFEWIAPPPEARRIEA